MNYHQTKFLTSAAQLAQLPEDNGIEIAFAGRSNAGKSSALNALTQQKNLARTSKTPGRTQLINLFQLDAKRRLVDLPGYGYAKVSTSMKQRWQQTLEDYLQRRHCLTGLILLMDCRHPLKDFDQQMLGWATRSELPTHILLTKADKLSRNQQQHTLIKVKQYIRHLAPLQPSVQCFSALKKTGLDELSHQLNCWFGDD